MAQVDAQRNPEQNARWPFSVKLVPFRFQRALPLFAHR
jgi:hypothetical protein